MVYNDTTNKQGIVQDAYWKSGADINSYPLADVTRVANSALDKVIALILGADGRWQFDSSNYTDLPIGSTDLISGQQDYSFDDEYLVIKSIECSDGQGNWRKLIPLDNPDVPRDVALSSLSLTDGNPVYYDKMGESILLYPAPSYNRRLVQEGEAGLRAYFQRKIDYFVVGDTTKEPGFAKHLHTYVSDYIALAYAKAKDIGEKIATLSKSVIFFEGNLEMGGNDIGEIRRFYSYREVDQPKRMTMNIRVKR